MKSLYFAASVLFLYIQDAAPCCIKCCDYWCNYGCVQNPPTRAGVSTFAAPTPTPCCERDSCDWDDKISLHTPAKGVNCRKCELPIGFCDPPTNKSVSYAVYPNSFDEPPKFLGQLVDAVTKVPVCGVSLISPHFVLTACKRCLMRYGSTKPPKSMIVVFGYTQQEAKEPIEMIEYEIKALVNTAKCSTTTYLPANDIGLVQTQDPITFTDQVKPARLPTDYSWSASIDRYWTLSSFRAQNKAAVYHEESVWYMKVNHVEADFCKDALGMYQSTPVNATDYYCTAYDHPTRTDGCQDDFGAALSYDNILFGILIFKYSCGMAEAAAAYVNVAHHVSWITENVGKLSGGSDKLLYQSSFIK